MQLNLQKKMNKYPNIGLVYKGPTIKPSPKSVYNYHDDDYDY